MTSDNILIELKSWLRRQMNVLEGCSGYDRGKHDGYMYTLGKIVELEEQKQVSDER